MTETLNERNSNDMTEFEELVNEVAALPEKEQEKIAFFINGYMAAAKTKDKAAV